MTYQSSYVKTYLQNKRVTRMTAHPYHCTHCATDSDLRELSVLT